MEHGSSSLSPTVTAALERPSQKHGVEAACVRAGGGYAQHRRRTMPAKRAATTDRDPVDDDSYRTRNAESWQGRPHVGDVVSLNATSRQEGNVPSEIPRVVFITDCKPFLCQDAQMFRVLAPCKRVRCQNAARQGR